MMGDSIISVPTTILGDTRGHPPSAAPNRCQGRGLELTPSKTWGARKHPE